MRESVFAGPVLTASSQSQVVRVLQQQSLCGSVHGKKPAQPLRVVNEARLECSFSKTYADRLTQAPLRRRGEEPVIPGPLVVRSALARRRCFQELEFPR